MKIVKYIMFHSKEEAKIIGTLPELLQDLMELNQHPCNIPQLINSDSIV